MIKLEPSLKEFSRRKFRDSFRETIPNDSETSRREIPTDVVTDPLNYYSRVYVQYARARARAIRRRGWHQGGGGKGTIKNKIKKERFYRSHGVIG